MEFENNKEPKINSHVSRLNRYLPFSVSHDQIYEEYQVDENGLSLKTRAFEYEQRYRERLIYLVNRWRFIITRLTYDQEKANIV